MAKDTPFTGGSIGNERLDKVGRKDNPATDRVPEQRRPDMDRYAVGSNDPNLRTK